MEFIESVRMFFSDFWKLCHTPVGTAIIAALLSVSEVLGLSDKFKDSAIMAYIIKFLRLLKSKVTPSKEDKIS